MQSPSFLKANELRSNHSHTVESTNIRIIIMSQNILITGAAGYMYATLCRSVLLVANKRYSGGSLLADLLSRQDGPIKSAKIFAVVRSNEQAQRLSNLGVEVIEADLLNESSVKEAIISRES